MIDLFGISDMWGAIEDIWARLTKLETALKQVMEDGPKFTRAVNNEARISLLEERFNAVAYKLEQWPSPSPERTNVSALRLPTTELPRHQESLPDSRAE